MIEPSAWEEHAACVAACRAGIATPDLWFPEGTKSEITRIARMACAICAACPVAEQCLEENRDVPFGIFGGQGPRRRVDGDVTRVCAECGAEFTVPRTARTIVCSDACRRDRHLAAMRTHYERKVGRAPDHAGSISRYQRGCRCSRCREVARKKRRANRRVQSGELGVTG